MSNSLESFVDSLNLPFEFTFNKNEAVLKLDTSNDYSKAYGIVSKNNNLNVVDKSICTPNSAMFSFTDGEYEVTLTADFATDIYKVIANER